MKFAHSFWSAPLLNNKFDTFDNSLIITLVDYALSCEYIHQAGEKIVLYADKIGAEILSPIPYDEVIIIEPLTDNIHFAANIKFAALEKMDLGDALIDGDIFLSKQTSIDIIKSSYNYDMVYSMYEPKSFIRNLGGLDDLLNAIQRYNLKYPYETPSYSNCQGWYNTSLMKINNQQLKDEYIAQYKYHLRLMEHDDFKNTVWPDVIIEQYHLTQLCATKRYKTKLMIANFPTPESNDYALKIGFTHLGCAKSGYHNTAVKELMKLNIMLGYAVSHHINLMKLKYGKHE